MSEPWKTDKWFTSPWNFDPEVTRQQRFPGKIQIHDVTLRDGEQQAGIIFTKDDKVRIAEKLAEVGVHRIEAGMPVVSRQDAEAIREIARRFRGKGPKIFSFARCMVEDVKRSVDCGVEGVVMEIPSSDHIIQYAYRWELSRAIDTSVKATAYAHQQGLYVVFFPIDFSRAPIDWVLQLINRVASEGHMDALAVVDTFGGLAPHTVPYLIRRVKEKIDKPLEAHFHDDFGMGAANTLLALAAGVEVAHTSVSGIGERAGNVPYEDLVLALRCMYNKDLGLKTEKFVETSRLVRELARIELPPNRPIVGDMLYAIESGIIVSWLKNCGQERILELCPFKAELVGQKAPYPVIGKGSGIDSIALFLEQLGVRATQEEMEALTVDVKEKSLALKRLLTLGEFKELVGKR